MNLKSTNYMNTLPSKMNEEYKYIPPFKRIDESKFKTTMLAIRLNRELYKETRTEILKHINRNNNLPYSLLDSIFEKAIEDKKSEYLQEFGSVSTKRNILKSIAIAFEEIKINQSCKNN